MRKTVTILGSIALTFALNSCTTNPVLTARGTTAFLSNGNKYSGADLQFGAPLPMESSKGHIDMLLSVGYGNSELINTTESREEDVNRKGITFGVGANYFFNKGRLQPFIGAEMFYLSSTKEKTSENEKKENIPYLILTPNTGLRFYFSNRFALTGSVGYSYHMTQMLSSKVNTDNINFNTGGIAPSVGLTYVLTK